MPYKISGNLNEDAKIIVVKENDWSVETTSDKVAGAYEITVDAGDKLVLARKSNGQSASYGDVTPESFLLAGGDIGIYFYGYDRANIDYITISSLGNASNFGSSITGLKQFGHDGASNGGYDRGIVAGGIPAGQAPINIIEYITISSPSNTTDFGDLLVPKYGVASCDNGSNNRALFGGGSNQAGTTRYNVVEYVTISSTGNASNFGEIGDKVVNFAATSNDINERGIFAGGYNQGNSNINIIEYVTITSLGDSTDFGDLEQEYYESSAAANA